MPVAVSPVVRELLAQDIEMPTDAVIKLARTRGVKAPDKSVKDTIYTIRSEMRKAAKAGAPKPAPAAAVTTTATATAPASTSASDLVAMLSNVALVNEVAVASGGVDQARKVAEAVRACGSVEAFLQHLELVAQVRGPSA